MTPKRKKSRNLFGFGKTRAHEAPATDKCGKRSGMTISEAMAAAHKAGQRSGDTGLFGQWACSQGLNSRSEQLKARLRREYHKGVEGGPSTEEKAKQKADAPKTAGSYKGVKISKVGDEYETSLERGTRFESLKDAKDFIVAWKKAGNPKTKMVSLKLTGAASRKATNKAPARNPIGVKVSTLKQGSAKATIYYQPPKRYITVIEANGRKAEYKLNSFAAAQQASRLKLAEVARNPGLKDLADMGLDLVPGGAVTKKLASKAFATRPKGKNKRRNPEAQAAKLYEEFHGVPSSEVIEYIESEHRHSVTVGIGTLIYLDIVTAQNKKLRLNAPEPDKAKFDAIVQVSMSEDGRQLYLVGGDQKIDLKATGLDEADKRDHMFIGTVVEIMYRTVKTFEQKGKEPVDFFHKFGKEGSKGICPVLLYNPRDERMKIYGGRYQIAKPEGWLGGVSPGIIG